MCILIFLPLLQKTCWACICRCTCLYAGDTIYTCTCLSVCIQHIHNQDILCIPRVLYLYPHSKPVEHLYIKDTCIKCHVHICVCIVIHSTHKYMYIIHTCVWYMYTYKYTEYLYYRCKRPAENVYLYVCNMLYVYILYLHCTLLFVVCVFMVVHTAHTVVIHINKCL